MVTACQFNQWPAKGMVVCKTLPNGGNLEIVETDQIQQLCKMAYDVSYNQQHIGMIMMEDFDEVTKQQMWRASVDGLYWSQILSSEKEALDLLHPVVTQC